MIRRAAAKSIIVKIQIQATATTRPPPASSERLFLRQAPAKGKAFARPESRQLLLKTLPDCPLRQAPV
jgi:hypothetical protein